MIVPTSTVCVLSSNPLEYNKLGSKDLAVLKVSGIPNASISNIYVCPRYSFNVGFCVSPSGVKTYPLLSRLSFLVTVYVLTMSLACPTTLIPIGPEGNQ